MYSALFVSLLVAQTSHAATPIIIGLDGGDARTPQPKTALATAVDRVLGLPGVQVVRHLPFAMVVRIPGLPDLLPTKDRKQSHAPSHLTAPQVDQVVDHTQIVDLALRAQLKLIKGLPAVRYVTYDTRTPVSKRATPNDPLYAEQWHLHTMTDMNPETHIGAEEAWDITQGLKPDNTLTRIAIIDDGIDGTHPDLLPRLAALGRDVSQEPADDDATPELGDHHGTQTAGTAAAAGFNDIGVVGACPRCEILPVRLIGGGGPSDLFITGSAAAEALVWATDNGADVINNSWGPPDGSPVASHPTSVLWQVPQVVQDAIGYATSEGRSGKGSLVVWSAGNGAEYATYDRYVSDPRVVAVGSIDANGTQAYYSDFGPVVDIVAPSSGGFGLPKITTTDVQGLAGNSDTDYSTEYGGTSAAGALVSGVAALVISAYPDLTAPQVMEALMQGAFAIDPGRGDYDDQGHSQIYGHGRVDAPGALAVAATYTNACTHELDVCNNNKDDDCDGNVDEGCDSCMPNNPSETCDSVDNNCDGRIDEDFVCVTADRPTCAPCDTSDQCADPLICRSSNRFRGTWCLLNCALDQVCPEGFSCQAGLCQLEPSDSVYDCLDLHKTQQPERCDGIDNDGNGIVDDVAADSGEALQAKAACAGVGVCTGRAAVCSGTVWRCITPENFENDETRCDGLDNDCDGAVDELGICNRHSGGGGGCANRSSSSLSAVSLLALWLLAMVRRRRHKRVGSLR